MRPRVRRRRMPQLLFPATTKQIREEPSGPDFPTRPREFRGKRFAGLKTPGVGVPKGVVNPLRHFLLDLDEVARPSVLKEKRPAIPPFLIVSESPPSRRNSLVAPSPPAASALFTPSPSGTRCRECLQVVEPPGSTPSRLFFCQYRSTTGLTPGEICRRTKPG